VTKNNVNNSEFSALYFSRDVSEACWRLMFSGANAKVPFFKRLEANCGRTLIYDTHSLTSSPCCHFLSDLHSTSVQAGASSFPPYSNLSLPFVSKILETLTTHWLQFEVKAWDFWIFQLIKVHTTKSTRKSRIFL